MLLLFPINKDMFGMFNQVVTFMLKDSNTKLNPDGAAQIVIQSDARDHCNKEGKGT